MPVTRVNRHGSGTDTELWEWWRDARDGAETARSASVVVLDDSGSEKARWNLSGCDPVGYWISPLDATDTEVPTETLCMTTLAVVGSRGLRTALRGTPGGVWAPRLVAAAGIGLLAAGLLVMDPGANFPVGAPDDLPLVSWHAVGHMVAGTVSFAALIAACFVLARHLTRTGRRGLAIASRGAGLSLALGWGWAMGGGAAGTLTLAIGAIAAMLAVAGFAALMRRGV